MTPRDHLGRFAKIGTCPHCSYMRSVALPDHHVTMRMRARAMADDYPVDPVPIVMAAFSRLRDHYDYPLAGITPWGEIGYVRAVMVAASHYPPHWEGVMPDGYDAAGALAAYHLSEEHGA